MNELVTKADLAYKRNRCIIMFRILESTLRNSLLSLELEYLAAWFTGVDAPVQTLFHSWASLLSESALEAFHEVFPMQGIGICT
jgi:hypothetical protein